MQQAKVGSWGTLPNCSRRQSVFLQASQHSVIVFCRNLNTVNGNAFHRVKENR